MTVNPLPNVSYIASPNDSVCYGNMVMLYGIGATSYLWSGGINDSVSFSATSSYNYIVSGTDGNGCSNFYTAPITVNSNTDIYGNISYSGGNDTSGIATLYSYESIYTSFATYQSDMLDASGNYYFLGVPEGKYIIKVLPDTLTYPTLSPTYYGNFWNWDSAVVIIHGCINPDIADVSMIEMTGTGGGIGLLHGTLVEGPGFVRTPGDPVHGVDIKLGLTGSSTIVASTVTDTVTGGYTFANVDFGDYTIYVDKPGLQRVSIYSVNVDTVNYEYLCLDYIADSASIFYSVPCSSTAGINSNSSEDVKFKIYPNPVTSNSTIIYSLSSDANVKLDVYNVLGIKLHSIVNTQQVSGEYQFNFNPQNNNLKPGIYFVALSANGKTNTMRIVVLD